ncbi:cytochrome c family protein [Cupriavidus gilardii]|uniref:c-type cytochrome n=1 Tax=Cupriavidus gilardii TaxID=82541 RepID=UPI001ABE6262|nr:cytochrome c family protein [Cupriavidus gilardii]MBO4123284.1 cytochrome c family protein [Cupriavidus gilardii]
MIKTTLAVLAFCFGASAHAAGDPRAGKAAFDRRCASCHKVGPAARSGFGPQLNGIVGRKAGAVDDYPYSSAMRASGIVWSDQTLAAFLRAPEQVVPGNRMRFWGIGSAQQIDDLLAYLRRFQ